MTISGGPDLPPNASERSLQVTALSPENAARLLARVGSKRATVQRLQEDIEAGAPSNPDGTISLIAYAAWLVRELADGR